MCLIQVCKLKIREHQNIMTMTTLNNANDDVHSILESFPI